MECLHGKPASVSTTKNGTFWFCGSKASCHFFCPEKDCNIFARAVVSFQASGCPHPVCHVHQILAKMRVVKNNTKGHGGRPFFVCSDRENPCSSRKTDPTKIACFTAVPMKEKTHVNSLNGNLSRICNVPIEWRAYLAVRRGCISTWLQIQVKHLRVEKLIVKKLTKNSFENL